MTIELDDVPREVTLPDDLAEALAGDPSARQFFDALSFTHRKKWVRWITEAKKVETRAARVAKTLDALRADKRTH
ncbi:MAG: YdeI/OmpD-associated family protein [Pseudonocardiaceae bacterium]